MRPNFCSDAYPSIERQNFYLRRGEAETECAMGIQNAHLCNGHKLPQFEAREEKHAEQETPLSYTH